MREADLTLGNGQSLTGPQSTARAAPIGPLPLVYAAHIALKNASVTDAALCAPNSLNVSAVRGPAIVVRPVG